VTTIWPYGDLSISMLISKFTVLSSTEGLWDGSSLLLFSATI